MLYQLSYTPASGEARLYNGEPAKASDLMGAAVIWGRRCTPPRPS